MARGYVYLIALTQLLSLIVARSLSKGFTIPGNGFKLFETHRAPKKFTKRAIPASHQHTVDLQIALKSADMDVIEKSLMRVTDPDSPFYGQHLDLAEVKLLTAPAPTTVSTVKNWLSAHGIEDSSMYWSHSEDWITLNKVPLRLVERMLDTTYSYYDHEDGDTLIRTESYSLPHELHSHVELIQPTTMFGRLQGKRSLTQHKGHPKHLTHNSKLHPKLYKLDRQDLHEGQLQSRGNHQATTNSTLIGPRTACTNPYNVTNRCLRELYKTDSYTLQSTGNVNKIGVAAYVGERANYEDLKQFLSGEGLPTYYNFSVVSVNGGTNPQTMTAEEMENHLGAEGNLDIQTTMGFTSPMSNVFYTTQGSPPFNPDLFTPTNTNEPYLEWIQHLSSQSNSDIPQVISTSYGDDEQTVPISYARKVCRHFALLGARGMSLIFASGDDGVGQEGTCLSNGEEPTPQFIPIFPASCPYVTAVGATQNFRPEVAVSVDGPGGYSSGGGFSDYFERPKYQSDQVRNYLSLLGGNHTGLYSTRGRGIPDVSAQGARYSIVWQKQWVNVGGSSAATPTFASIIALLNDQRLANGWKPMGFLNPWLYKRGYLGLNDILEGSSSGCGTSGFAATRGWDPVTGLGTPNFETMKSLMIRDME